MDNDLHPFSIVENKVFIKLIHCLHPKYTCTCTSYYVYTIMPDMYNEPNYQILETMKFL